MTVKYKNNSYNDIQQPFLDKGFLDFGQILDQTKCSSVLERIKESRDWSMNLFRSESEVIKKPQTSKVNPGRGISNLAESYDLDFIENNKIIRDSLELIVGKNYEIILKKFVVGVPDSWVPKWLKPNISKQLVANLGQYIKEEYRDVSYFRGIDYHMDLIDHPGKIGDYITLYIYLNDVNEKNSPLHVIEKSHIFGATKFPHFLNDTSDSYIEYGHTENNLKKFNKKILTGGCGSVYLWSSMTLHGTTPATFNDSPRTSLRYTIKKNSSNTENTLIDSLLKNAGGNLQLNAMRDDVYLNSLNGKQSRFNKVLK